MIINEDFEMENSNVTIEEEIRDGKKQICFKGVFSEADKMNRNHRIYPKSVLREAFNQATEEAKKSGSPVFGELEHASDSKIHLERIAVTFPELNWNEETGQITGKAIPTLTEAGKVIEGLAKSGIKICFSTRCSGRVKPYKGPLAEGVDNAVEVCPGLRLISVDCVGTPSCQAAVSNTVYEGYDVDNDSNTSKNTLKSILDEEF